MRPGTVIGILIFFIATIILRVLLGGGCVDGWQSPSIGRSGACSHHGGVNNGGPMVPLVSGVVAYVVGRTLNKYLARPTHQDQHLSRAQSLTSQVRPHEPALPVLSHKTRLRSPPRQPRCPRCNGAMRRRLARRGPNSGNAFLGCALYPSCKGTVNLPDHVD
jgi:hypothetical protein